MLTDLNSDMRRYSIIGIIALFAGCELVVDVDVPVEPPVLTLNAFMIQDSVWSAQLSLSRHILDEADYRPVADGVVVIYHNDQAIDTLAGDGNGLYMGDGTPVPGETYEIRATSPTYGTVRSTSYVPVPVEISDIEVEIPTGDVGHDDPKIQVRLRMKDRASEKNFYQVMVMVEQKRKNGPQGQEQIMRRMVHVSSKDPSIDNENVSSFEGLYFKDVLLDGKEITLPLELLYWEVGSGQGKIIFMLRTISEDFYRYKTSALLQNETSGNPFAQPAGVYNNIENGFGIFGGFSQSLFVYEKK